MLLFLLLLSGAAPDGKMPTRRSFYDSAPAESGSDAL